MAGMDHKRMKAVGRAASAVRYALTGAAAVVALLGLSILTCSGLMILSADAEASGNLIPERRANACELMGYPSSDCDPVISKRYRGWVVLTLQDGSSEFGHEHGDDHEHGGEEPHGGHELHGPHPEDEPPPLGEPGRPFLIEPGEELPPEIETNGLPKATSLRFEFRDDDGEKRQVSFTLTRWPDYYYWPRVSSVDETIYEQGFTPEEALDVKSMTERLVWHYAEGSILAHVRRVLDTDALPVILKVRRYEVLNRGEDGVGTITRARVVFGLMEPHHGG